MRKFGFELKEERELHEVGGVAKLWRHIKTGAELLSIINKDENKCFGVNFFTPPTDSTGVAHILEHSVLCGSRKYPLKEPFVELLKGSLQTFLNAFTFPDKTCYPVASANLQDFYNLMDVYLDAVFHPLLSEDTFRQEGWHIEAESADAPWTFKGVVYNEMKGVYSSPDSVLAEQSQQAVFPDNLYSLDSGGNPERIPDLGYIAFKDFHQRYYQPGNARFFFWGDDPEGERLKRIDAAIADYGPVTDLPQVVLQPPARQNRYLEIPYAAAPGETRAHVTLNWLLGERGNIAESLKMEMLEHILEGLPGSPLRRALMESGFGEDSAGCGLETDLRQMYYSTGLKGLAQADSSKVEDLILDTLADLAKSGIDEEAVEAAVNSVEFNWREANSGRFPQGLAAMLLSLSTWLYGGDPFAPLAWEKPLNQIKADLANGKKVFEEAIRANLLENNFCRVLLLPNPNLAAAREAAETGRLTEIQAQTGPTARQALVNETKKLQVAQLAPDSPDDLARIPALGIGDLPKKGAEIPTVVNYSDSRAFIAHDLPTRGIAYFTLLLPITKLPERLIPLLALFARSLTECGSAKSSYSQLGMAIAAKTGALDASILTGAKLGSREPFCYLCISGKALYDKLADSFALMREILLEPQNDPDVLAQRLELMLKEAKARLEHNLQSAGHSAASLRLGAHFCGDSALAERLSGISQLDYVRSALAGLNQNPESLLADLADLRKLVISAQDVVFDSAAEASSLDEVQERAAMLLADLPGAPALNIGVDIGSYPAMSNLPQAEAFLTPGQVNYVAKAANLYANGYEYTGAANVVTRWLRMGRLWDEVRVAGGAYGAFCNLDRVNGTFICSSYRDPNVDRTLSAYDGVAGYLRSFNPTENQLRQAIVGAVGAIDAYMLPDAKASTALMRYLVGMTPEIRQQGREQMFAVTARDFHEFADALVGFAQSGDICVIGGAKAAQAAGEHGWTEQRLV